MNLICIKCPRGCNLSVKDGNVTGNLCPRGVDYAREEMTCPMRIVTSLIRTDGKVVPVKTNIEVPKDKIREVLTEISNARISNFEIGQVVISHVAGTNADVVITGEPYSMD